MRDCVLREKAKLFALRIIKLYKYLEDKKEFVLSKQLLRSGTGIGANVTEGYFGQSKADFVAKMGIALKEAGETMYWLELIHESKYITTKQFNNINDDCVELVKLLTSSIKTAKKNQA